MGQESKSRRREFLERLGFGFVGFFAGTAAPGAASGSRLFAGQFLRDKQARRVPQGYYDPNSQLYRDAETRQPMFVAEGGESPRRLSTEELLELIRNGRFVDISTVQIAQGPMCSNSLTTSLSTTGPCCPIATDTQRDRGCDDMWDYPAPR